jgi:4-hydroxy-3-methylbut-2-enyl diphosphate reductase
MQITLANPRGFCAGVDRAIEIVERALKLFGTPVYVRHEVVHNKYVVDTLRDKGAVFVNELDEVPDESVVIFSAHGVSKAVREEAARRKLRVFDAICPLVTKVHMEVGRYQDEGRECILIGHAGHPEVEGTLGQYRPRNGGAMYLVESVEDVEKMEVKKPEFLAFVTQTTLSVDDTSEVIDALRRRFPKIVGPKKRGYLLRHTKPSGRGQETDWRLRPDPGRGFAEQLEFHPPDGALPEERGACLPDR